MKLKPGRIYRVREAEAKPLHKDLRALPKTFFTGIIRAMSIAVVTGSAGLIGSETCKRFHAEGLDIVGVDNDMRAKFFGAEASTAMTRTKLEKSLKNYRHEAVDIRDTDGVNKVFAKLGSSVKIVIHTAAQPSHDWAAREPHTDFGVNAVGTLNLPKQLGNIVLTPFSFSPVPTRFTATRRTVCRCASWRSAGKLIPHIRISSALTKVCRLTRRNILCLARAKLPPMFWCRNTAVTSV
jgi:NAD dependent epimerase/dehydratase family